MYFNFLKRDLSVIRGNFLILILSWILMRFSDPLVYTYFSLFVLELGGTPYIIGLISFISNIILALLQPLGGFIADIYGRRRIIVLMTFCLAFSNIFFILAENWIHILLGSIISHTCLIYIPALSAIMADSLPPEKRSLGFSISRMINIVSIFSPIFAGFLVSNYGIVHGMKLAYIIVLLCYLLASTIRIKLKETINIDSGSTKWSLHQLYFTAFYESFQSLRNVQRIVLNFLVIRILICFSMHMSFPFFLVYAKNILNIEEFQWAILGSLYNTSSFFTALLVGKIIDLFGCRNSLVISCILQAFATLLFLYSEFNVLMILFPLWAIFDSILIVANDVLFSNITPRTLRGRIAGIMIFLEYLFISLGGLIGGFLYEYYLPILPFILSIILTILCAILYYNYIIEPTVKEW